MSVPVKQMEIERATNMLRALGWELVESKIGETEIVLVIKKKLGPELLTAAGLGPGVVPA